MRDERIKYLGRIRWIASRRAWTELAFTRAEELFQTAANPDDVVAPVAYLAFLDFYDVSNRGPFYRQINDGYFLRDIFKGYTQTIRLRNIKL
ncbi:MAG: hypothetical protein HC880_02235 [Bacteroidia bacterium]|nr:hypothetical protein [Bacteroidia bacterium]